MVTRLRAFCPDPCYDISGGQRAAFYYYCILLRQAQHISDTRLTPIFTNLQRNAAVALSETTSRNEMGKKDATTHTTADVPDSPEILTDTRKKSFSNPIKSFRNFKAAEAAKEPTAAAQHTSHHTPLMSSASDSMPATSGLEQDDFIEMMRATRGMSPEEVKAFLDKKTHVDQEKYKNQVSGPSDSEEYHLDARRTADGVRSKRLWCTAPRAANDFQLTNGYKILYCEVLSHIHGFLALLTWWQQCHSLS